MLKFVFNLMALVSATPLREILNSSPVFDDNLFKQLLVRKDLNHLLLTDVEHLTSLIGLEFSEVVTLKTIGQTWQGRNITMIEIDAREYLQNKTGVDHRLLSKPAILLTGAHHAREFVSIQMPLYSVLRMLHGGIVFQQPTYISKLIKTNTM